SGPDRPLLDENIRLSSFCPQPFFHWCRIRFCRGFLRGNWLDGLRIPQNASRGQRRGSRHCARPAMGAWHIPVIDYLGTSTPHGAYWFPVFIVFTPPMSALS